MSSVVERLYAAVVRGYNREHGMVGDEGLSPHQKNLFFVMNCNGYFKHRIGGWQHLPKLVAPFVEEFKGQNVSFFGPSGTDIFFSGKDLGYGHFLSAFDQPAVTGVIEKYRSIDEDQAARIAFILGGIVRRSPYPYETIRDVEFIANMTRLGERHSGDAIASAMAMYIISGGPLDLDREFMRDVYNIAEAVGNDPVVPRETGDLGLSQVARLRAFEGLPPLPAVEIREDEEFKEPFDNFPTVGAEFHFPEDAPQLHPRFWQRLALLNISQYQRGSYIQLSRNDRGVIEVRMNPSVYPVTVANWGYMKRILGELDNAFFHLTINRRDNKDFSWSSDFEKLNSLKALGMLSYASLFENAPKLGRNGEVNFGDVYLGQTVRLHEGKYMFTGHWGLREGSNGQMSIYTGFGENLPHLAYFLSMLLANPNAVSTNNHLLLGVKTLGDALAMKAQDRRQIFRALQQGVRADVGLSRAAESGRRMLTLLGPDLD